MISMKTVLLLGIRGHCGDSYFESSFSMLASVVTMRRITMAIQEVPWVAKACLLLIFVVSTAPADEAELHTAVV